MSYSPASYFGHYGFLFDTITEMDWYDVVHEVTYLLNGRVRQPLHHSPADIIFTYPRVDPLLGPIHSLKSDTDLQHWRDGRLSQLKRTFNQVLCESTPQSTEPGDEVYLRTDFRKTAKKLPKYTGPYRVIAHEGVNRWRVCDPRDPSSTMVHNARNLKKRYTVDINIMDSDSDSDSPLSDTLTHVASAEGS